jgi:hypothetical protein
MHDQSNHHGLGSMAPVVRYFSVYKIISDVDSFVKNASIDSLLCLGN